MTLAVVCFYWRGEDFRNRHIYEYSPEYVNRLRSMLERHLTMPHELVCVTDEPEGIDERIRIVPMPGRVRRMGTYFPKLYAFHPDGAEVFGPRIMMIDLDVVIVRNMDFLSGRTEPFIAWSAQDKDKARYNTSLVLMDAGRYPDVWRSFDPSKSPGLLRDNGYEIGDQDWASHIVGDDGETWARRGEGIEPYYQIRHSALPDSAAVVFFNGRRSPALASVRQESPWVAEHWR